MVKESYLKSPAACWLACNLLLLALAVGSSQCEDGYTVPNPFFNQRNQQEQQDNTHNNFYHISATELAGHKHEIVIDEFFSLGRGLSYTLHTSVQQGSWAVLTDGRAGRSYLVRNPDEANSEQELDCELDHVHSHKHLFPWQYVYEVSRTGGGNSTVVAPPIGQLPAQLETTTSNSSNRTRRNKQKKYKRRFKATIFGIGAVWLNMIKSDVRSSEIGSNSPYNLLNAWKLSTNTTKVELLFHKRPQAEQLAKSTHDSVQLELDKSEPAELKVRSELRQRTSSEREHIVSMFVQRFESNLEENKIELLQKFRLQLRWCQNQPHRQFPNLLRALATSSDRVYKIDYVTQRYNLFDASLMGGKFDAHCHRHMWPMDLASEMLSLKHDVQTFIYDAGVLNPQSSQRMDLFMSRFTENSKGRSPRYATAHYHDVIDPESESARSCTKGEREGKPKFRLLSTTFTFKTAHLLEYEGHIHGVGALLLNALEMRRSFNLMELKVKLPNSVDEFMKREREATVDVWQVHDKRDHIRVLFFIEKRNPSVEARELDLAERDRKELARLVRIDIRSANIESVATDADDDQLDPLAVTQELIDRDDDLMVQYHIFDFAFELDELESEVYLEIPSECLDSAPQQVDDDSSSEDEDNELHDPDYERPYHDDDDEDADSSEDEGENPPPESDLEAEFDFESGLLDESEALPEFVSQLSDEASYEFVTRLELLDDDGQALKSVWLVEWMDLARERSQLKVFTSRSALELHRPAEEFFIAYASELVFHVEGEQQRRCRRVEDVPLEWLRLFSAHLVYYLVKPDADHKRPHELSQSDLVVESNQLSSYGIGAMWRRANQLGTAQFKGRRKSNSSTDARQLVWAYNELDMRFEFTFLQQVGGNADQQHGGQRANKLKLDSILIRNQYQSPLAVGLDNEADQLQHFKPIRAVVEKFQTGDPNLLMNVPFECTDQLIEAQRMFELDTNEKAPKPEQVLGSSQQYEMSYSVYTGIEHVGGIRVRESFDKQQNRGKIVISEGDPEKQLTIYIDGQRRLFLAMSIAINKCSIITELSPTFGSFLSAMVLDNGQFDPNKFHGLMGLWQALSERRTKVHVRQLISLSGEQTEERTYSFHTSDQPRELRERELQEQIDMRFVKAQTTQWGGLGVFEKDKVRIRKEGSLRLTSLEFSPITRPTRSRRKGNSSSQDYTHIIVWHTRDRVAEEWQLPQACEQLLDARGETTPNDDDPAPPPPQPSPASLLTLPKESDLFRRSGRFQMRSEISVLGDVDRLYLLDELRNEGEFQLSSHGLGALAEHSCDLLMFLNTCEQFDLSQPLQCNKIDSNSSVFGARCLQPNLLDVWCGHPNEVHHLGSLFYGPLSLWRMAERIAESSGENSDEVVKLIKTIEISRTNEHEPVEQFGGRLPREMEREVWMVSNIAKGWSYTMEFVRLVDLSEGVKNEWHVLDGITVTDKNERGELVSVFVDVVNYSYEPERREFAKLFRLPEGWGCQRDTTQVIEIDKPLELKLGSNPNMQLSYEASLELLEDVEVAVLYQHGQELSVGPAEVTKLDIKRQGLPTQIGAFLTGGHLDGLLPARWQDEYSELPRQPAPHFEMDLQQSLARFPNGVTLAKQVVVDRLAKLSYEFNSMSGQCNMGLAPSSRWGLSFATPTMKNMGLLVALCDDLRKPKETDLFTKLFLLNKHPTGGRMFHLVNLFIEESDPANGSNVLHAHYEHQFDSLTLFEGMSGPARVVRKFETVLAPGASTYPEEVMKRRQWDFLEQDHIEVDKMNVRVYMLTEDSTKVRAIFDMSLRLHQPVSLSDFLALTNVAECYNEGQPLSDRRQASFVVEYSYKHYMDGLFARMFAGQAREFFYALLLAQNRLMPSQLDGKAHFEFSQHDQLMRVHFNVLEAPSSYVYFQRRYQCTMNDRMSVLAETRILPTLLACSRWCDQMNCIAMSYCDDHQCQVVTKRALFDSISSNGPKRRDQDKGKLAYETKANMLSLENCAPNSACTYHYYLLNLRPRPLSALSDFLDRTINSKSNKQALRELSLPLGRSQLWLEPVRFSESVDKFRWQHEDLLDPFEQMFQLAGSEAENSTTGGADLHAIASSFAVWRASSEFGDANSLDQLNEKLKFGHQSKFLIMWAVASSRAGCLQECQRNQCLLVTSCPMQNRCQMIVASGRESILELNELKQSLVVANSSECTISIRDHLDRFHLFENTQKPERHSLKLAGYTKEECAAACQTIGSQCLAFDVCYYLKEATEVVQGDGRPESVCFLQDTHVSQDSFDRSVLLPVWDRDERNNNTLDGRPVVCDHYSRSVLAEFQRVPNMKLRDLHQSALLGVSADKCAADCLQDDTCQAFEHCQNPRRTPTQSCYLIKVTAAATDGDGDEAAEGNTDLFQPLSEDNGKALKDQLILSRVCSIYLAKAALNRQRLEQTFGGAPSAQAISVLERVLSGVKYLLVAAAVGALVQVAYIRLTRGKALVLHRRR